MWQRSGVIGKRFDIEKDRSRNVGREVSPKGIDLWRDADRRQRGIKDNDFRIVEALSQPRWRYKRIHANKSTAGRQNIIAPALRFQARPLTEESAVPRREFPDAPIVGVGAVVLDGGRVLLVRRGQEPLKGEWSIPGGALELGETLEAGVRREVAEETGLEVRVVAMVEVLDRIVLEPPLAKADSFSDSPGVGRVKYHYVLVDFLCIPTGGSLGAGSDAMDVRWIAHEELNSHGIYRLAPATVSVIEKAFTIAAQLKPRQAETGNRGDPR